MSTEMILRSLDDVTSLAHKLPSQLAPLVRLFRPRIGDGENEDAHHFRRVGFVMQVRHEATMTL